MLADDKIKFRIRLAGLDSEAVRRWVAEAARTVRHIPPPVVIPSSSSQVNNINNNQQQQENITRRQTNDINQSTAGVAFGLPTPMTQTPSMHLLENNNLIEVAMAQQQQQQQQQQQHQMNQQKQKQTSSPINNNTIETTWRSIASGQQWWNSSSNIHQEQDMSPIPQVSQVQSIVSGTLNQVQRLQQQQSTQSDVDQPLDFSVGSLQQQRLHARVRTMHERLQSKMHDNNNGGSGVSQKIVRNNSGRRSYSPSEVSTSASEDEGVSTGGSPSGPLRGTENDSCDTVIERSYGELIY
ncbi:hypothetical protein PV327_010339 [Microctonus hyperodae]|uniref:Uncharacterized protein n=1 Tax=Microctonus hyperodae TaxID=165561 RepID=A0AA39KUY3_MICHY|nr:hypothetical protein PV327_010339 [Microctonus hyperodae]